MANELKINKCDKCFYIKDTSSPKVIVWIYVYDMLIIKRQIYDINATKHIQEQLRYKNIEVTDVFEKVLDKFKYLDFNIDKRNKCGNEKSFGVFKINTISLQYYKYSTVLEEY